MYLDYIERLSNYIDKRFPEPALRPKKAFKRKTLERCFSQKTLLKLYDRIVKDPYDVLDDMLYYYNGLLCGVRKDNHAQIELYNIYIKVLTIMKEFIMEEEKI